MIQIEQTVDFGIRTQNDCITDLDILYPCHTLLRGTSSSYQLV